jgi:hypothetical protein
MALGHDHRQRPEGGRRAQHRADVLGIGHLVENHDRRRRFGVPLPSAGLVDGSGGQRLDLETDALVHGAPGEIPGEFGVRRRLDTEIGATEATADAPAQPGERRLRREQPAAASRRVGEGRGHRVMAVEPKMAFVAPRRSTLA